jgi:hypothetical protein
MSSGFSTASLMQNGGSYSAEGPNGFAFRLNGDQYKKSDSGAKDKVASFVHRWLEKAKDPAADIKGMPPLFGQDIVPHAMTFSSLIGSYAKTYLPSDESLESNPLDAILMRKDLGIMECLEIRQRMCALLDWSIVPEDDRSPAQKSLAAELTKILRRIRRFTEYRRCLMDAVWVGKSCIQHRPGYVKVGGFEYVMPKPLHDDDLGWSHIHGDKIIFRYDDGRKYDRGYPGQMGIRVSAVMPKNARVRGMGDVEATNSGMAMFLSPAERKWVICHKHMIEDSEFSNPRKAGRIHGVGIRDRIYNEWFLKQETLGFLMEYLERSAGGIEIWEYPSGDQGAKASIMDAAKNRMSNGRNQLFFPKPLGMDGNPYDLRIVEPGFQGIDMLLQIQDKYFGHRIKRYIIGQTLTTEADATGLGSGVADAHKDTLSQIVRYDAHNLEETITHETVRQIQIANWPETEGWMFNVKLELESDDAKGKMEAFQGAWNMGLGIPEKDVAELIGVSLDNPGEKVLRNQSAGAPPMAGGQFPPGTGFENQIDAAHKHVQDHGELGQAKRAVADQVKEKLGVGGDGGGMDPQIAGASPSSADQYQRRSSRLLDIAASETHTSPTPAQKEAGNYSKGIFPWRGLEIAIENPKGSERKGCSPSGGEWHQTMACHYGYFRRTEGADGDQLDVFIGTHPDSDFVLVIKQIHQDGSKEFDEFKVVIGCLNRKQAKKLYLANYPAGWKCGPAAGMTVELFKRWIAKGGAVKAKSIEKDEYARQMSLWNEDEHPRDAIGEFAKKEESASKKQSSKSYNSTQNKIDKPGKKVNIPDVEPARSEGADEAKSQENKPMREKYEEKDGYKVRVEVDKEKKFVRIEIAMNGKWNSNTYSAHFSSGTIDRIKKKIGFKFPHTVTNETHFSVGDSIIRAGARKIVDDAFSNLKNIVEEEESKKKKNMPAGVEEIREAISRSSEYYDEFQKAMEDEYTDGVFLSSGASKAETELKSLREKYPDAEKYLIAEKWSYASHYAKAGAGKRAVEAIHNGMPVDEAVKIMNDEWTKHVKDHIWD